VSKIGVGRKVRTSSSPLKAKIKK